MLRRRFRYRLPRERRRSPRLSLERIELAGADLHYDAQAIAADRAAALFTALRDAIAWERHRLRLFGRWIDAPRLSCWIGDPGAAYTYSRVRFEPRPWPAVVRQLRTELHALTGIAFNSVLANRYRDGRDSMGWHADDERELGDAPVIASLSFGATRVFRLRSRHDPAQPPRSLDLGAGSLLLMSGPTQRNWQHALPKTSRDVGERINLTFRHIMDMPASVASAADSCESGDPG